MGQWLPGQEEMKVTIIPCVRNGRIASFWFGTRMVVIEYKYGPLTILHSGESMKKRKELLNKKLYRNAYVQFLAMLMVRKEGKEKYTMLEDFSNVCTSKVPVLASE